MARPPLQVTQRLRGQLQLLQPRLLPVLAQALALAVVAARKGAACSSSADQAASVQPLARRAQRRSFKHLGQSLTREPPCKS